MVVASSVRSTSTASSAPTRHSGVKCRVSIRRHGYATGAGIPGHGRVDIPRAQLGECKASPASDLANVLGEDVDRASEAAHHRLEAPPAPTELSWRGFAHRHHLGPGDAGRLQECDQGGIVRHRSFVEDGDVAG
jgi:hypothetical protein